MAENFKNFSNSLFDLLTENYVNHENFGPAKRVLSYFNKYSLLVNVDDSKSPQPTLDVFELNLDIHNFIQNNFNEELGTNLAALYNDVCFRKMESNFKHLNTGEAESLLTPSNGDAPKTLLSPSNGKSPENILTPSKRDAPKTLLSPSNGKSPETLLTASSGESPVAGEVGFPLSIFVLLETNDLKETLAVLDDELLLQLNECVIDERDFTVWMNTKSVCTADKKWNCLICLLAQEIGPSFTYPESNTEAEELFKENDIYHKYICLRELRLAKLREQLSGTDPGSKNVLTRGLKTGLAYFEQCMFKCYTLTTPDLADVIWNPHWAEARDNVLNWMPTVFDEKSLGKYKADIMLFELVAIAYPGIDDVTILTDCMKVTMLLFNIDDIMEGDHDYMEFVVQVLKKLPVSPALMDKYGSKCGVLRGLEETVKALSISLKGDIMQIIFEFIDSTKTIRNAPTTTVEEYYKTRFLDGAIYPYIHFITLYNGHGGVYGIPDRIFHLTASHLIMENDLYSYGYESMEADTTGATNIVEVYKKLFPAMSMQEIAIELEKQKAQLTEEVLKFKGTEWEYLYYFCVGNSYFTVNCVRYGVRIVKSKNTSLVLYK